MRSKAKAKHKRSSLLPKLAPLFRQVDRVVKVPNFAYKYLAASVLILASTSVLWTVLGTRLQQSNADQLVSPLLFQHWSTFHGAAFPAQHTFLLKWPFFWLLREFGYSSVSFMVLGLIITALTVGTLAYLLHKIERRPVVLGTIYIGLASCLLMIPPVPYAGALLPANMAMLTTRNLEYIFYIGSLYFLFKSQSLRTWRFWLAAALLGLVFASDKLFLTISVGGALLALLVYALAGAWSMVSSSVRWLSASLAATLSASLALAILNSTRFTHIISDGSLGPYKTIHSLHDALLGTLYGVLGLLTNLGANPAYDATVVRHIPSQAFHRLFSLSGPAYLINLALFAISAYGAYTVIKMSWHEPKKKIVALDQTSKLSMALISTSLAALAVFILTNHYWAVDSRYLGIFLFTAAVSTAAYTRQRKWSNKALAASGIIITCFMALALPGIARNYNVDKNALANVNLRNRTVAQVLAHHHIDSLVGDYWRVVPIMQMSQKKFNALPLATCTAPRADLSSTAWQPNLDRHSFAYLLTLDNASLTGFNRCSLDEIIKAYGRPNTSVVLAGKQNDPKEMLLFYDRGAHNSSPTVIPRTPSTILPIPLSELPYTACPNGTTIMNIVAHQDDDLLFMNPDTSNSLRAGHCIRTVYVTAGDAGSDQFYWLGREQGSEAAYSLMLNSKEIWVKRVVSIGANKFVDITHPRNDYRVSLVFMHLPDGNITGSGFGRYLHESLAGLESGRVSRISTVDNQSSYTSEQLVETLDALMHAYQPVEIRTLANYAGRQFPDHSDHSRVGQYAKKAYAAYESQQFEGSVSIPISFYIGYPVHAMPANVFGDELARKYAAWFAYAAHDDSVCRTQAACDNNPAYGYYLKREYQSSY